LTPLDKLHALPTADSKNQGYQASTAVKVIAGVIALGVVINLVEALSTSAQPDASNNNNAKASSISHVEKSPVRKVAATSSMEWYNNGRLHKSTIMQWREATQRNQLATSADWALTSQKVKSIVMKSGSMDTLRPYANNLRACVSEAGADKSSDGLVVSQVAAACIILLGWG